MNKVEEKDKSNLTPEEQDELKTLTSPVAEVKEEEEVTPEKEVTETPPEPEKEETEKEVEPPPKPEKKPEEEKEEEEEEEEVTLESITRSVASLTQDLLTGKELKFETEEEAGVKKPETVAPPPPPPSEKPPEKKPESIADVLDIVSEADYDKAMTDRQSFNKVMTDVVQRVITGVYSSLPEVVNSMVSERRKIDEVVSNFYEAHPEYTDFKELVSLAAARVQSANPGMSIDKVLEVTDKFLDGKLNLQKLAGKQKKPGTKANVALPPGKGAPPEKVLNEMQQDLKRMEEV